MDKIQPLFTATATSVGGRNGHTESSDHIVSADLSVPRAMGGPGKPGTATPEHLFAAGYAAYVAEITEHNSQRQHALMMALARGEMPYGQFVQEDTLISIRTAAAIRPSLRKL